MSVLEATKVALAAAGLSDVEGPDAGAVAVLLKLAAAVDAIDDNGLNPAGKLDNVSVPTYLKYAEALRLTPAARAAAVESQGGGQGGGGNLAAVLTLAGQATGKAAG